MQTILLIISAILVVVLINAFRNESLNKQILRKQKELGEVNIELGNPWFNTKSISVLLTCVIVSFIFIEDQPTQMKELTPEFNFLKAEIADDSNTYNEMRGGSICIFGALITYDDNSFSLVSEGNNEIDYIFSYDDQTLGYEQFITSNYSQYKSKQTYGSDESNHVNIGVYVSEIMESYPMQGIAIEIVEECE